MNYTPHQPAFSTMNRKSGKYGPTPKTGLKRTALFTSTGGRPSGDGAITTKTILPPGWIGALRIMKMQTIRRKLILLILIRLRENPEQQSYWMHQHHPIPTETLSPTIGCTTGKQA